MTDVGERQALAAAAVPLGWNHRVDDHIDHYLRGNARVRVIWQGDDGISGGTLFHDDTMMTFTRDLETVNAWLIKRAASS